MDARLSYREAAVQGASPVGLVVLLYEQLLEDLRRAVQAIDENDIELRTNKINHAVAVIGYLQDKLDLERGGSVAGNLERFYNHLRSRLMEAQCKQSKPILVQQIEELLELRDAWVTVEQAEQPNSVPQAPASRPAQAEPQTAARGWNA